MLVAISRLAFSFCHRRRSAPMRVPFAAGVGSVRRRCEFRSAPVRVPFGADAGSVRCTPSAMCLYTILPVLAHPKPQQNDIQNQ